MAHDYDRRGNVNHMFIPWYSLSLPMTNEEFKTKVLFNDENRALNVMIKSCPKPYKNDHNIGCLQELHPLFKAKAPFKDILKKYKELCARFI